MNEQAILEALERIEKLLQIQIDQSTAWMEELRQREADSEVNREARETQLMEEARAIHQKNVEQQQRWRDEDIEQARKQAELAVLVQNYEYEEEFRLTDQARNMSSEGSR